MTERLTAADARAITDQQNQKDDERLHEALDDILATVKKATARGEYRARVTAHGFSDGRLYMHSNHDDLTTEQQSIVNTLHDLGYETHIAVEEKQFVDIYLEITW